MQQDNKKLGIAYMCIASLSFAFMSLFIKLSGDLPTVQKVFFRNLLASIVFIILMLKDKTSLKLTKEEKKTLFFRALSGTIGVLCYFYSIDNMNISDAAALNKLTPFFAIFASLPILGESIRKKDVIATAIAFIGSIFVVKPSFSLRLLPALSALTGGLAAGIAYSFVRKAGKQGVDAKIIIVAFSLFSCVVTLPFIFFVYKPMSLVQLTYLILASLMAMSGQFFNTKAYSVAKAGVIAVYDYLQVVYLAILGFFIFGELADIYSFIGYVIIIGVAVFRLKGGKYEDRHRK